MRRATEQDGFTIIELFTVVVILGVLAMIAVPTFLGQRERAQEGAAGADIRNITTAQYSYLSENDSFAGTFAALASVGVQRSSDVDHAVCEIGGQRFIIGAVFQGDDTVVVYDSDTGVSVDRLGTDPAAVLAAEDPGCAPSIV